MQVVKLHLKNKDTKIILRTILLSYRYSIMSIDTQTRIFTHGMYLRFVKVSPRSVSGSGSTL